MRPDAQICDKDLVLMGDRVEFEEGPYLGEGREQIELALKNYKNDRTRYDFEPPALLESMASGTPCLIGHLDHNPRDMEGGEGKVKKVQRSRSRSGRG